METVLSTFDLTKRFKSTLAVDKVCINVNKGDVYGLIGRNGAGKTTILKMISGFIRPTSGGFSLFGVRNTDMDGSDVLRRVGTLIETPGIHSSMSAYENLEMKCICGGIDYSENYIMELLSLVGLASVAKKKAGGYSLGMKQRLGIALALVGEPELLVLDEPINGLDPQGIAEVREILIRLHEERGMTVVVSSHILEELSKIVTHYGIIDHGRIVKEITREELEYECSDRVEIAADEPERAAGVLRAAGYASSGVSGGRIIVKEGVNETPAMVSALCREGLPPRTVEIKGRTLEAFYLDLVGGEDRA